ncbi:hypothetical protein jhhlp_000754 [Lomentospora prolificans]|uniref:Uncharacterized protein n=1 Tax=Lomentospora prolificans TaxID=41688 RepID=A0A2N3NJB9_9PEZI|nr:hypothetical protein jhhlp_000754 [Lomentospora prolificans]
MLSRLNTTRSRTSTGSLRTSTSPKGFPIADQVRREGITVLNDPEDCAIDLIIVHGLNGAPHRTFYNESTGFFWPSELPKILPTARIMLFGYIADVTAGSANPLGVYQHAESLLLHLRNNRVGSKEMDRSIVFLGHSLGGIVIKQALVISSQRPSDSEILRLTKVIFFLGTPHRGSHLLDRSITKLGLNMMKLANREVPKNVKTVLQPRGDESFIVNSDFMRVKGQIAIVNFYEQVPRYPSQHLVVDKDSAVFDCEYSENIPVARDHEHLVRFENVEDDAFHMICQTLQRKIASLLEERAHTSRNGYTQQMMRACLKSLGEETAIPTNWSQFKEPHRDTLGWVWSNESDLKRWLQTGSGLFAITGKPGSGKSVLMSEVSNRLRKSYRHSYAAIVQHSFNTRGAQHEHSFDGFLSYAIIQIIRQCPSAFDAIMDEFIWIATDCGLSTTELCDLIDISRITWSTAHLRRALRSITSYTSQKSRMCFLLDALDECDEGTFSHGDLVGFLESLCLYAAKDSVCVCFSSRDLPTVTIPTMAGGFRMEDRNGPDITAYINDAWSKLLPLVRAGDSMKQMKSQLIQRADGIFLWAHLALERVQTALRDGATVAELSTAVEEIPDKLGDLFALLLGNIEKRYIKEANVMLSVVLSAHRPLTLGEFRYITVLQGDAGLSSHEKIENSPNMVQDDEAMKRRIRSRCGGLLEVKEVTDSWSDEPHITPASSQVVQFMHQSVGDFLTSTAEKTGDSRPNPLVTEGHVILAKCCTQYITLKEVQDLGCQIKGGSGLFKQSQTFVRRKFPFLGYAAEFCFHHCEEAEKLSAPQTDLIDTHFGNGEKTFQNYVSVFDWIHRGERHFQGYTLLQLCVEKNLATYVDRRLARDSTDINELLDKGQSYVQVAVSKGHQETLRILLKYKAHASLPVSYFHSRSTLRENRWRAPYELPYEHLPPLVTACKDGNLQLVEMLLANGADISDCTVNYHNFRVNQALIAAAYSGKVDVVEKVLQSDPVTFSDPQIRLSAIIGLLDAFGGPLSEDGNSDKHSYAQRVDANLEISQLILQGIDVYQFDFETVSASSFWYMTGCNDDVLLRLIEIGTDFSGAINGFSFLHSACCQGSVDSVRRLLEHGADVAVAYGKDLTTCLQLALRNSSSSVLSYLLSLRTVPIDDTDISGNTALHTAARENAEEFVEVLLLHGADKRLRNFKGHRPFHYALSNRRLKDQVAMLERLVCDESDINFADTIDGVTPIQIAAACGALQTVEWLLRKGAGARAIDSHGRSAIHTAASSPSPDSTDTMTVLLEKHNLSATSIDYAKMTPLHHVLYSYEYDSVGSRMYDLDTDVAIANAKVLLRNGADVNAQDIQGNTPLHHAAWRGSAELIRLFLREGANPTLRDANGLLPLDLTKMEDVREILEGAMEDHRMAKKKAGAVIPDIVVH